MAIFDDAHAVVLIADYLGVDAAGKINAIGAGFALMGLTNGVTAPHYVAAVIDVPGKYAGTEMAISLELLDDSSGKPVAIVGESGRQEPLRLQQVVKVERLIVPMVYIPETMFCRAQLTVGFQTGLPLRPSTVYTWRIEIDGQHRKNWRAAFYVIGPPPAPVLGGPSGPANIPPIPPHPPDH